MNSPISEHPIDVHMTTEELRSEENESIVVNENESMTSIIHYSDEDELVVPVESRASITIREKTISLFLNQLKHNLTNQCVVDSAIVNNFCAENQIFPLSYATLRDNAKIYDPIISKYYYCGCGIIGPVDKKSSLLVCKKKCKQVINCKTGRYFCYISLKSVLEYFIPQIHQFLRFNHSSESSYHSNQQYHDITDGSAYRSMADSNCLIIYFGFDGVFFTEKGNRSIWPLVIYICELPFNIRTQLAFPLAIHSCVGPQLVG